MEEQTTSTTASITTSKSKLSHSRISRNSKAPHIIIGNLNTVRQDVKTFYEKMGTKVIKDDDEERTDLEKAIIYVLDCNTKTMEMAKDKEFTRCQIVVLGAIGNYISQALYNIHLLEKLCHQFSNQMKDVEIFLLDEKNMISYLAPGENYVRFND